MKRVFLALMFVFAGFAAGLGLSGRMRTSIEAPPPTSPTATDNRVSSGSLSPTADARALQGSAAPVAAGFSPGPDFTRVASQAIRGVANISSVQVQRRPNSPFMNDPFFDYFFGGQDMFGSRDQRSLSLGSGVVVSADGYVVTNAHVVGENVREVTVALSDKRELEATIVGLDPATDIALLKVSATALPTLAWGDSSRLQVGEWVLAIGSPFQLSQTVTAGIVSATGRQNVGFADYEDFIQTDAAINPGNSGGALVNSRGELVGINTGIFSQSGGYQGVGFAVPSNLARHIVDELIKSGEVVRGTILGVRLRPLTPRLAAQLNAPNSDGVLVAEMSRASDAYRAGMQPGDIIVAFNGEPVADASRLYRLLADSTVGSTATVRVIRGGRPLDLKIPVVSDSRARR
jgi:serine protease Do